MRRISILFLLAVLLASSAGRAADMELRIGQITGHPEWLTCAADADCVMFTTSKCALQMSVNKKFEKQSDEAASAKLKCEKDFPPFTNPRAKCSAGQCTLVVTQK